MEEEIKLKRVDLRLKPDLSFETDEVLNEPLKAVDFAQGIMKNMKPGQMAILNLTTKGNVLRVIITSKKTISNLGPGLAAVLRESLLSNCVGIIAIEKNVLPRFNDKDRVFAETLLYAFRECSINVTDYIKVPLEENSYVSMQEEKIDFNALYAKGRNRLAAAIKDNSNRDYKMPLSSLELIRIGGGKDLLYATDAIDAVINDIKYKNREHLCVIAFDKDLYSLGYSVVSIGTVNSSLAGTGEIFRCLISQGAASFVMIHNHPSSNPEPSSQDDMVTLSTARAAKLVGLKMMDHLIVGGMSGKYYSYAEEGRDEYGLRKWSDVAKETNDEKLISWFSVCRYVSVKLGLLLNPHTERYVIEKLAEDGNETVSRYAKQKLNDYVNTADSVKRQIEMIRQEVCHSDRVAEANRIYSYGKELKK
ncbi:MAG: JAB domain-containing protein [Oribacterium sp.]|nr:JAB domain-containing protein [Oribacterium sp.]